LQCKEATDYSSNYDDGSNHYIRLYIIIVPYHHVQYREQRRAMQSVIQCLSLWWWYPSLISAHEERISCT